MTKHQKTYAKFEALEEKLGHCFLLLHDRFITDPPLAKFWAEMAMEELKHSSILRFCRERGLMADANVDFETASQIEELLDTVKGIASDPDVSADEAFFASLLMEASELENAYQSLTHVLAKDYPALFDAIRADLRSHYAAFAEAAYKFSADRGLVEAFRNIGRSVS